MTTASWKIVIILAVIIFIGFGLQYQFLIKPLTTNANKRVIKQVKTPNTAEPTK